MPFNLSEAMGYGKIVSKLDTDAEIVKIPLEKLDLNEKNFFTVEDVQDLVESIQVNGVLEPLLVLGAGDRYRIIAGHRRHKALTILKPEDPQRFGFAPCIVLPAMSDAMEQLALIQTNTTARDLSYSEKMVAAERIKKIVLQLKDEGVKLPGKLRDIQAEQLQISASEVARMNVIQKNLSEPLKEYLKIGKINPAAAYELARLSPDDQNVFQAKLDADENVYASMVSTYADKKKCEGWLCKDCPWPRGYAQSEQKRKGEPVDCNNWTEIMALKEKGHPEKCPGCCFGCDRVKTCKAACWQAKDHLKKPEREARKAEAEAEEAAAREEFQRSCLHLLPERLYAAMVQQELDDDDLADQWSAEYDKHEKCMDDIISPSCVRCILDVQTFEDLEWDTGFSLEVLALAEALDVSIDWLYGRTSSPRPGAGWHKYPDEFPMNGQTVVVRRRGEIASHLISCAVFRDYRWYEPGAPDLELRLDVIAWTDAPD